MSDQIRVHASSLHSTQTLDRRNFLTSSLGVGLGLGIQNLSLAASASSLPTPTHVSSGVYVLHRKSGKFLSCGSGTNRRPVRIGFQPASLERTEVSPLRRDTLCPTFDRAWVTYDKNHWERADLAPTISLPVDGLVFLTNWEATPSGIGIDGVAQYFHVLDDCFSDSVELPLVVQLTLEENIRLPTANRPFFAAPFGFAYMRTPLVMPVVDPYSKPASNLHIEYKVAIVIGSQIPVAVQVNAAPSPGGGTRVVSEYADKARQLARKTAVSNSKSVAQRLNQFLFQTHAKPLDNYGFYVASGNKYLKSLNEDHFCAADSYKILQKDDSVFVFDAVKPESLENAPIESEGDRPVLYAFMTTRSLDFLARPYANWVGVDPRIFRIVWNGSTATIGSAHFDYLLCAPPRPVSGSVAEIKHRTIASPADCEWLVEPDGQYVLIRHKKTGRYLRPIPHGESHTTSHLFHFGSEVLPASETLKQSYQVQLLFRQPVSGTVHTLGPSPCEIQHKANIESARHQYKAEEEAYKAVGIKRNHLGEYDKFLP